MFMGSYLTLGNGQSLYSRKIGKNKVTVVHANGSKVDVILLDCKFVPNLFINLCSVTKATSHGWELSNRGLSIVLQKSDLEVIFDLVMKTENGYVDGVEMVPTFNNDHIAMKKNKRDLNLSPLGGESTSNSFSDNALNCVKFISKICLLPLLDGNPSVARQK